MILNNVGLLLDKFHFLLQECQQLSVLVNDRVVTSTDVQLDLSFWPKITTSQQTVLVLEAAAMPVCCLH